MNLTNNTTESIGLTTNTVSSFDMGESDYSGDVEYGHELYTASDCVSDSSGNEANAVPTWTENLSTFESQSLVKTTGSYGLKAQIDTTQSAGRFFTDLEVDLSEALVIGNTYKISFDMRHTGTGTGAAEWKAFLDSSNAGQSGSQTELTFFVSSETTFQSIEYEFVHSANTKYFVVREVNTANDGGVYIDNLSIRKKNKGAIDLNIAYTDTQFVFKFKLPSTKSINIIWGDGTSDIVSGNDATEVTVTSSYSTAGNYFFNVIGDIAELTSIDISVQSFVSGSVSDWDKLTNLTYLNCSQTGVYGDVSGWSALTGLTNLYCSDTGVTGDISGWSTLVNLTILYCNDTVLTGDVSSWSTMTEMTYMRCVDSDVYGDISSWSAMTKMEYIFVERTGVTGNISGFSAMTSLIYIRAEETNVSGDISGWSVLSNLTHILLRVSLVSGDISSWVALTNLTYLLLNDTNVSGDISQLGPITANLTSLRCATSQVTWDNVVTWNLNGVRGGYYDNNWSSTDVDNCLLSLAAGPVVDCEIDLSGNNAARTSASDAAMVTLIANNNIIGVNV